MTVRKALIVVLKIIFLFFSLIFIKDAFYYWDGYSFYMRFKDFLPDLALTFILWNIIVVIPVVLLLWLLIYGLFKLIPKSLITVKLEQIITWLLFSSLLISIKRTFGENINLSGFIGFGHMPVVIIGGIFFAVMVWFLSKYINFEKMLLELNNRLTPVVWLFVFLLIIAVPLSFIKKDSDASVQKTQVLAPENSPNIILIIMDALSAEDMQVYGYNRPTTPFISEWSKDSILFKSAYSVSNWTCPTTMSLMTGQKPWTHKVWHYMPNSPVKNYENNLSRVLYDNGYAVYAFVQNDYAHPETLGLKDSFLTKDKAYTFKLRQRDWLGKFERYLVARPITYNWFFVENNLVSKQIKYYRSAISSTLVPPEMVYDRFLKNISQSSTRPSQPFFAWLHVLPPHDPYLPPEPYMGVFGDAGRFNSDKKFIEKGFNNEYLPEKQSEVDILRKRYDEFILYSDRQFELFLSRLAKTIDMSNTIIVLSADHGESFSHGFYRHDGPYLYEPLIHIPLIVKLPGREKNRVIDVPVEQTDIAPTILELAGIKPPEWMEGRSLIPLLEGKPFEQKPLFSMQLIKNSLFGGPITKGTIAVRDGNFKLIYYLEENKVQLFNLKSDPDEAVDISGKESKVTHRLKRLIEDNLADANKRIAQIKESS